MPSDYGTFPHLAADKRHRYREGLGVFATAKARFVLHLRPSDVVAAMPSRVNVEEVDAVLRQLVGWGNLSADPDIAEVHDYLDAGVPMLAAMYRRRLPGYKELGFTPGSSQSASPPHRGVAVAASARASYEPDREPTAAQVRAWARAAGHAVSDRGRLPADLWEAYRDAHR